MQIPLPQIVFMLLCDRKIIATNLKLKAAMLIGLLCNTIYIYSRIGVTLFEGDYSLVNSYRVVTLNHLD